MLLILLAAILPAAIILYYIYTEDSFIQEPKKLIYKGIGYGVLSVPGHSFFAVLMGYFYSLAHFQKENRTRNIIFMILLPILAHGLYNTFVGYLNFSTFPGLIFSGIFLYAFNKLRKYCSELIKRHKFADL